MDLSAYARKHRITAVIMNPRNFYYFTGINAQGILIQGKKKRILLSSLDKQIKDAIPLTKENLEKELKGVKRIGLELSTISHNKYLEFKKPHIHDLSPAIEEARSFKSEKEIRLIKKACKYTDEIFASVIKKRYNTEKELQALIIYEIYRRGLEPSFTPIVASGKNAGTLHHIPGNQLNKGFLIIDFGVKYKGYCSDMTRTLYIGKPTHHERAIYDSIISTQDKAIKMLCTHSLEEIDSFTRNPDYPHSLGHGIGLDIHEKPFLRKGQTIKEGMVLAIEPGRYTKTYGIRIEDDILIRKRPIQLTHSIKELIVTSPKKNI
ncbi:MAG: M24 family metallopeptidase [Candidatus Woesearchaeota archaeon]